MPRPQAAIGDRHQRGLIFYAFVITAIFLVLALFGARAAWQGDREQQERKTLEAVRDALLAHLAAPELDAAPGRRLGQLGMMPDLAFTGAAAPITQCAYRTWAPGQALAPADALGAQARCFGRVPWKSLGVDLGPVDPIDLQGRIPWLVVSPNLAVTRNCMPNFTPLVLGATVSNTCPGVPTRLPFPWLTVVDERGNVLSNRVAFALIMPGPPAGGPSRAAAAPPSAWLNKLTVNAGCPAPCVPGTYDNAAYQQANGLPTTIVTTGLSSDALQHLPWLQDARQFRNRVLWVGADELFRYLERRARQQLDTALLGFKAAPPSVFPYAAAFNDATGSCRNGLRFGHPAVLDGNCGAGKSLQALLPSTWTDAGWQQYFVYAVSPTCVAGNPGCAAPGLRVNGTAGINALMIGPGAPFTTAPFAASRGAPQAPMPAVNALSPLAADYLDSTVNVNGGTTGIFASAAPTFTSPNDDRLDIVQ